MSKESKVLNKEIVRVALDPSATKSYEAMARELRSLNGFLKFHPSEFISQIVSDYLNFYFKSNRDHLMASFFDSHAYVTAKTVDAKGKDNFMEVMQQVLEDSKKIKSKLRRSHNINVKSKEEINDLSLDDTTL